jgi:hypothetical protein
MSGPHSNDDDRFAARSIANDGALLMRNGPLREIILQLFLEHDALPCEADAVISKGVSQEIIRLIEETGVRGEELHRRLQLFAADTLLAIREYGEPSVEATKEFLGKVLGQDLMLEMTEDDTEAVDQVRTALSRQLAEPQ